MGVPVSLTDMSLIKDPLYTQKENIGLIVY